MLKRKATDHLPIWIALPAMAGLLCACAVSLPDRVQAQIRSAAVVSHLDVRNLQFTILGAGRVPNDDQKRGVEAIICYTIRYDALYTLPVPEHTEYWLASAHSGLAVKQGNGWVWGRTSRRRWAQSACPGEYESRGDD